MCCTCLALIFIAVSFVVKYFVEEQCFGEPANQIFMTSHLTDNCAIGQRHFYDEQFHIFVCVHEILKITER